MVSIDVCRKRYDTGDVDDWQRRIADTDLSNRGIISGAQTLEGTDVNDPIEQRVARLEQRAIRRHAIVAVSQELVPKACARA